MSVQLKRKYFPLHDKKAEEQLFHHFVVNANRKTISP